MGTIKPNFVIRFQHPLVRLVQRSWEGDWATSWPVWRILADSTAVARQVPTPIFAKSGTRKTACLDLPSGPQHLQGTGKHVVEPDLAQPVPYTLGTSRFTCRSGCANRAFWLAHGSRLVYTEPKGKPQVIDVQTLCKLDANLLLQCTNME